MNIEFEKLTFSLFEEIPEQCQKCEYHKLNTNSDNWCYMFKDKPEEECKQFRKSDNLVYF